MSPNLTDQIAKAAAVLADHAHKPDDIHQLLAGLCAMAEAEGELLGIDKSKAVVDRYVASLFKVPA